MRNQTRQEPSTKEKKTSPQPIQIGITPLSSSIPSPVEDKPSIPHLIIPTSLKYSVSNETYLFNHFNNKNSEMKPLTPQPEIVPQVKQERLDDLYTSYTKISKSQKGFLIAFVIGIVLAMSILGLSTSLFVFNSKNLGGTLIFFALVSILVLAFSMYVIRKNTLLIRQVIKSRDDPERILQSRERMLLYICLYFFMAIFVAFFTIACGLVVYQTNVKMNIRGIGYNQTKWQEEFGDASFDDVIVKVSILLSSLGGLCFVFSLFVLGLIVWLLVAIKSYRTWKVIIEFVCVLFFQASFIYVLFATNGIKFRNITAIEEAMPGWVTLGLFVIGIIGLVIGIIAFFVAFIEHKILLKVFCVINALLSITLVLLNIGGTLINANFKGYEEAQCNLLFSYVDKTYLVNHLDCQSKYLFTSESIERMQCPKHRIIVAWELDEEKSDGNSVETYGCINQKCCMAAYSYIKEQYDYLTLLSYVLMLISVLLIVCSHYLIRNSESHFDEGIRDNFLYFFMLFMSLAISLIMIPLLSLLPSSPLSSEFTSLEPKETNVHGTVAPSDRLIPASGAEMDIVNEEIEQAVFYLLLAQNRYSISYKNSRGSNDKSIRVFEFILRNTNGNIVPSPTLPQGMTLISNQVIDRDHAESVLVFQGTEQIISSFLNYITVDLICEYSEALVNLTITGTVEAVSQSGQDTGNNQQDSNVRSIELDLTDANVGDNITVLNKQLNFSLADLNDVIYLTADIQPPQAVFTSVYPLHNPNCSSFFKSNNDNGSLTIGPLYKHQSYESIEYNITVNRYADGKVDTANQYVNGITIGGISRLSKSAYLGRVSFSDLTINSCSIKGTVINSMDNKPLRNIEIQLSTGYKSINISDTQSPTGNFPPQTTKADGSFLFSQLVPGQYTIILSNAGYYLEERHVMLMDNDTADLSKIALTTIKDIGQLTFVLSWKDGPADLDLQGSFEVEEGMYCSVSFANQKCVEMQREAENDYGGAYGVEKITINAIGDHFYMVFVHKYRDISNDIAKGETMIEGLEELENKEIDTSLIPDTALSQSGAAIKVYGPGYRVQIASLDVPNDKAYDDEYNYWLAFCLDGSLGISSYTIVNKMLKSPPDKDYCKKIYR